MDRRKKKKNRKRGKRGPSAMPRMGTAMQNPAMMAGQSPAGVGG